MKLLCLALLVLMGHQALTSPQRMKRQPFIPEPVPAENTKGCKEGEFECDGYLCVAEEKRCDGRVNCKDGTDEDKCCLTDQVEEVVDTKKRQSRQGCGEVYTSSNGVIKHPMSGGNYENNEDCVWKINAAEPIKITFVTFHLEADFDYLYVRNGQISDSPLLGSFTGSTNSNPVQTTKNSAYLLFSSDCSVTKSGFELRWEPVSTTGPSDCACGQVNPASRIVNGVETEVNEYPWQAAMVQSGSSWVLCGGSVIGSKYILTAAHCTQDVIDYGITYQDIQVLVGAHQLSSPASSQIRLEIARFIQHPGYDADLLDNDISIIELSGSIDFRGSEVRPVCLPYSDTKTYDSVTATVSGWGDIEYGGDAPDVLMEVDVPTMSNDKCSSLYADTQIGITDNMICAGHEQGGNNTCQGDSGGALSYKSETGYTQIGLVSFAWGCALAGYPTVFTRVSKYLSWISNHTASGIACSAAKSLP